MKSAEIRSLFLKYFEKNGHTIVESSSLVPQNDPTLLFTNAGMVQFKDVFLGKDKRAYTAHTLRRNASAPAGNITISKMSASPRDTTPFSRCSETFSFGDYFKKDAIHYAWEFVTKELKLPKGTALCHGLRKRRRSGRDLGEAGRRPERPHLPISARKIISGPWATPVPAALAAKFSSIAAKSTAAENPLAGWAVIAIAIMEFWNLVFHAVRAIRRREAHPASKPSVDTGAGLERIASILQEVDTNYDTDIFHEVIHKQLLTLAKQAYDPNTARARFRFE